MSRKHYRAIAAAIADARKTANSASTDHALDALARTLACIMKDDNDRFDLNRFLTACGIES